MSRTPKQNGYAPTLATRTDMQEVNMADAYNPDGSLNMKLSGSNVPEAQAIWVKQTGRTLESVVARAVRTANFSVQNIAMPKYAKGFVAILRVYGVTGTFAAGQGYSLSINLGLAFTNTGNILSPAGTKSTVSDRNQTIICYPGNKHTSIAPSTTANVLMDGPLIGELMRVAVNIDGTFTGNEGIDCSVDIQWLI